VDQITYGGNQLADELIDVICKEGMIDRELAKPDASIESLDLKSIDIVIILTAIEEKFDVYLPMDGSLQEAKTIQDLVDVLARRIQSEKS
jgi:acyl carrier protein